MAVRAGDILDMESPGAKVDLEAVVRRAQAERDGAPEGYDRRPAPLPRASASR